MTRAFGVALVWWNLRMLELTLKRTLEHRVDGSPLVPERLAKVPLADLLSLPLSTANSSRVRLEELFWVQLPAGPSDMVVIRGDCSRLDELGRGMSSGTLMVDGSAGDRVGSGMRGGTVLVAGDAGDEVCSGMRGGVVAIAGRCGDRLAMPLPGERSGMRGGDIVIAGSVGVRACQRMRRGTVCIAGDVGEYLAPHMIAGTILVLGNTEAHWGLGIRRGSLLFANEPIGETAAALSPRRNLELSFLPLIWNHLRSVQHHLVSLGEPLQKAMWRAVPLPSTRWVDRRIGDTSTGGCGEVLVLQRLSSIALPSERSSMENGSAVP
jgi:formylmethanofuran dehydrogenase subunit C